MAVSDPDIAVTRESPMFLDPTVEEDVALISFNSHGKPEPCPNPIVDLDEWDKQRIEFSIKRYGLDDQELCNERKELWVSLTSQFNEYADLLKKAHEERCSVSKGRAMQKYEELKQFLDPNREFTALVKACFSAHKVGKILLERMATYALAA